MMSHIIIKMFFFLPGEMMFLMWPTPDLFHTKFLPDSIPHIHLISINSIFSV